MADAPGQGKVRGLLGQGDELHLKDEGGVRADAARAIGAVGQIGGDGDAPFGAHGHELEGFREAGDDLTDVELDGLFGLVEHRAVYQRALVHHFCSGGLAVLGCVVLLLAAGGQNFILETTLRGHHAVLLAVFFHVLTADFEILRALFIGALLEHGAEFSLDGLHIGSHNFRIHAFVESIGDALGNHLAHQVIGLDAWEHLRQHLSTHVETDDVGHHFLDLFHIRHADILACSLCSTQDRAES